MYVRNEKMKHSEIKKFHTSRRIRDKKFKFCVLNLA